MLSLYLADWLALAFKFLHLIAGIAWIGASFYFNWLENKLKRVGNRDDIAGHLWAVHGGGFYYLEKYKIYPDRLPPELHWFKWEAYVTWLSGFALLSIMFYLNASSYLLLSDSELEPALGVLFSAGGLVAGWVYYDLLCKSAISRNEPLLVALLLAFITLAAYGYSQIFAPRAMFLQIGAMIGTVMAANVFFVIIPSQKILVKACAEKKPISEQTGRKGYRRSRHNNYFTLPVLFAMISGHFPMVYSTDYNWLVLLVVVVTTAMIRHYFNLPKSGWQPRFLLVLIAVAVVGLMLVLAPDRIWQAATESDRVPFAQAQQIVQKHCISCHSKNPTDELFSSAPNGFVLDTPAQITAGKDLIYQRTVATQSMPLANKTKMTPAEREILGRWIRSVP